MSADTFGRSYSYIYRRFSGGDAADDLAHLVVAIAESGKIPTLRVLLLGTFRPEFESPWIGRPYVTALTVNRMAEREIGAMIDGLVGNQGLPADLRQDIIERTDGIPLFVEEMTKALLEAGAESAARPTAAAVPSAALAVPASLHASLMARLDRLGPAKEVAQVGAAIGREFSHALLGAVVGKSEPELNSALDRLITAGLLFRQGMPPFATYLFKHVLVQDAAYGTLLREPRRALHARVAETLESQFAEITGTQPELLARQYTDAGLIEKAAGLWGKAGQRSLERSALLEAVAKFTRGLDQIASLPGTPALRSQQIKLQVGLANALYHMKGFSAVVTKAPSKASGRPSRRSATETSWAPTARRSLSRILNRRRSSLGCSNGMQPAHFHSKRPQRRRGRLASFIARAARRFR